MDSINNACKFGSDAWLELQAFKTRQLNRREKLTRHKNLNKDFINGIVSPLNHNQQPLLGNSSSSVASNSTPDRGNQIARPACPGSPLIDSPIINSLATVESQSSSAFEICGEDAGQEKGFNSDDDATSNTQTAVKSTSDNLLPTPLANSTQPTVSADIHNLNLELVECLLILKLCDVALKLPIDSRSLQRSINRIRGFETVSRPLVENLLEKFAHQELITIEVPTAVLLSRRRKEQYQLIGLISKAHHQQHDSADNEDDESCIYVTSSDHTKLVEFDKSYGSLEYIKALVVESKNEDSNNGGLDDYNPSATVPIQSVRTTTSTSSTSSTSSSANFSGPFTKGRDETSQSMRSIKADCTKQSRLDNLEASDRLVARCSTAIETTTAKGDELESLLSLSSTRERESKKLGEELLELLSKPTAKEKNLMERFRSADGYQVQEFCPKGTKGECRRNNKGARACDKLHFKKIIARHTEESLGDCSFLNTCFHMDSCKYVHYEVDYDDDKQQFKRPHPAGGSQGRSRKHNNGLKAATDNKQQSHHLAPSISSMSSSKKSIPTCSTRPTIPVASDPIMKYTLSADEQARIDAKNRKRFKTVLYPPQWIQCDLRFLDMSLLGKFSVVMADPPWDIHMELPYGTMSDDEMRKLNIPALQDEGVIFLWVTGRAMELGRECLALWGYERCDEIIWVKTNQLQRIIRTGRTGHWLNHGKEHCLVGVKGQPKDINRGLDCDVIVAEVRATSHKPDEIYGIIERLSPGTRKIELFGRAHNVQPNWVTLGNQLNGVRLIEPDLVKAFKKLNLPFQTATEHSA